MSVIAIIPARRGSRRISGKNLKEFHGRPIISHSIETAKASGLFDKIVVSTDSHAIAEVARCYGAEVLMRPAELAVDEVGTRQVIAHAAKNFGGAGTMLFDYVCGIYATAPLMRVEDLVTGYEIITGTFDDLPMDQYYDHVISVGYPPLQDAAQFYFSSRLAVEQDIEYFDHRTALVKIPAERVMDINTPDDWAKAEEMYASLT